MSQSNQPTGPDPQGSAPVTGSQPAVHGVSGLPAPTGQHPVVGQVPGTYPAASPVATGYPQQPVMPPPAGSTASAAGMQPATAGAPQPGTPQPYTAAPMAAPATPAPAGPTQGAYYPGAPQPAGAGPQVVGAQPQTAGAAPQTAGAAPQGAAPNPAYSQTDSRPGVTPQPGAPGAMPAQAAGVAPPAQAAAQTAVQGAIPGAPTMAAASPAASGATAASTAAKAAGGVWPEHRSLWHDVVAEWHKISSLRSSYWTIGVGVVLMPLMVLAFGAMFRSIPTTDPAEAAAVAASMGGLTLLNLGISFAQLAFIVFAAFVVTNEYSSGTIRLTMTSDPRRVPILAAKSIVLIVIIFVAGVVATALSTLAAIVIAPSGHPFQPFKGEGPRVLIGMPLYLVAICLLTLMVGAIFRNAAATISIVLGDLLVLEAALGYIPVKIAQSIAKFMPGTAGQQVYSSSGLTDTAEAVGQSLPQMLSPWAGYAVLWAWVIVVGVVATIIIKRRDV